MSRPCPSRNLSEGAHATTNPANRGSKGTSIADLRGDGDSGAFGVGSNTVSKGV
jgi:hypothetical protein